MNANIQRLIANRKIKATFTPAKVAAAVKLMTTQREADAYCSYARLHEDSLCHNVVFGDPGQFQRLLVGGALVATVSLVGLVTFWNALRPGESLPPLEIVLGGTAVGGLLVGAMLLLQAARLWNSEEIPAGLTADQVSGFIRLRLTVGEAHKLPPTTFEKVLMGVSHGIEAFGIGFFSLMGLQALPPNWAAVCAVALGVVITASLATLGRLHAQRSLIRSGVEQYRSAATLARDLENASDPEAGRYAEKAEALREALSAANVGGFAEPSKLRFAVHWVLLGALIGATALLRVILGGSLSNLAAVVGALMLGVGAVLVFWANHRQAERSLSVAGDSGKLAMRICRAFPTIESFLDAQQRHISAAKRFFSGVMVQAVRIHQDTLNAMDIRVKNRKPLIFSLNPSVRTTAEPTASIVVDANSGVDKAVPDPSQFGWSRLNGDGGSDHASP